MKSYTLLALAALVAVTLLGPSSAQADHSATVEETEHHVETEVAEAAHEEEEEHHHEETTSVAEDLSVGSQGDGVSALQTLLIKEGFLAIDAPTGYFGPLTLEAVKKLQTKHGVASTGFYGPLTRAALGETHTETPVHAHEPLDVSDWNGVPAVSIELHKDAMAGWNLEVDTKHFEFAPEHVNGKVRENEGHAHVYVNGVKYARLYGSWMHLPGDLFTKDHNEVRVTLNANDHSDIAIDGKTIEATEEVHAD